MDDDVIAGIGLLFLGLGVFLIGAAVLIVIWFIVSAIIAMAHSLSLSVIAEGVEELEHMQLLGKMECDIVQGFYLARPMPASDFEQLIISNLKRRA